MVVEVDSPPIGRLPNKLMNDPELREYFIERENIIYQLWRRTGGFNDDVSDTALRELYPFDTNTPEPENAFNYSISTIERETYNAVSVEADYTALPYDFVNARQAITIKLPAQPNENDTVIIRNGANKRIEISGNSKNINGKPCVTTRNLNTTLVFRYFLDTDEWFVMSNQVENIEEIQEQLELMRDNTKWLRVCAEFLGEIVGQDANETYEDLD